MTEFVVIFIVPANLGAPLTNTFSALIFSKHISGLFVCTLCILLGFAPIFPDICYHLTHYKPAA
ncbi:hypothetical protein, partial [Escherichia coli]